MHLKSKEALRHCMNFRGVTSGYALARKAGLKPAIVGHLVSGRRKTCSPGTAYAIERALDCAPNFLFEAKMSQVSNDTRQIAA